MYSIYYRSTKDTKLKKLDKIRHGSWVNVDNATEDDIRYVCEITNLAYDDVDDALDSQEIPRIEKKGKSVLIFLRNPTPETDGFHTQLLTIVITPEYFISISPQTNSIVESYVTDPNGLLTTQRTKLLLSILLSIVNQYAKEMKTARAQAQKINQLSGVTAQEIIDLTKNEQILNQYLVALIPTRNIFEALLGEKIISLYQSDTDLLEDLTISIRQSVDVCTIELKSIQSIRNAHQIIFNNDLNKTIKLLTSFTIIMTIPTIIASLYGMNISLPLSDHPVAFGIIMLIIFGLSILGIVIFRLLRWL